MNGNIPLMYYERKLKSSRYNDYLRDVLDPFNISDRCFIDNYRLPKSIVHQLIEDIKFFVPDTANTLSIPLHLQVLASLNFYASGSHQLRVGLDAFARMSQSKISTSLARISDVIATKFGSRYVCFPLTLDAANAKKEEFLNKYGVPGIVGLIDCTHIALADIKRQYEYSYVNRKNYHSINTQAICDLNMRILNINARYPGSTHDSHIWDGSKVLPVIKQLNSQDNKTWLLGDGGYALKPYLLVPYRTAATDSQKQFNKVHCKIRSGIERCFGILKSRFRCLKKTSGHLHYSHDRAANIIYSCAVLHNILVDNNYPVIETEEVEDEIVPVPNAVEEEHSGEINRSYLSNFIYESSIDI